MALPSPRATGNATLLPAIPPGGVYPSPRATGNATLVPFGADPDSPFRAARWNGLAWVEHWFRVATWDGSEWDLVD